MQQGNSNENSCPGALGVGRFIKIGMLAPEILRLSLACGNRMWRVHFTRLALRYGSLFT